MNDRDVSGRDHQRPLRIAFIVTEYPKTTETFLLRDIMEFSRNGCEIQIFTLTHINQKNLMHDFAKDTRGWVRDYAYIASRDVLRSLARYIIREPKKVGLVTLQILSEMTRDPVMVLKSLFILPKSLRIAREVSAWRADHVHAAYAGHPATAAWIIKRVTGIPFSCSSHAHDLFETQALLARKLPEAALVRTISEYNKAFILKHVPALVDKPPVVIHVGTYLSDTPRPPIVETEGFRILYVGSLEYRKGVDLLLRALAKTRQRGWNLEIIGDGPERGELENLAKTLDLGDHVAFRGALANEAVGKAMLRSSVLVVPSRIGPRNQTEGLPTVIVEAFAARLPVIATRLTGIPEIVRHEETGLLFEMENEGELIAALVQMESNPDIAQAWAEAGRALVEQEFDQTRNAHELLERIRATLPATTESR